MKDILKKEFEQIVPSLNDVGGSFTELGNGWSLFSVPMNDIVTKQRITEWLDSKTSLTPKSRYGSNYLMDGEQMVVRLKKGEVEFYFGSNADNVMRPALWEDEAGRVRHAYFGFLYLPEDNEVAVKIIASVDEMHARKKEGSDEPFHTLLANIESKKVICDGIRGSRYNTEASEVRTTVDLGCYGLEEVPEFYYMAATNGCLLAQRTHAEKARGLSIVVDAEWYTKNGSIIKRLFNLEDFDSFVEVLNAINLINYDHVSIMNVTARSNAGEALWWKNIYAERGYDVPDVEQMAS